MSNAGANQAPPKKALRTVIKFGGSSLATSKRLREVRSVGLLMVPLRRSLLVGGAILRQLAAAAAVAAAAAAPAAAAAAYFFHVPCRCCWGRHVHRKKSVLETGVKRGDN